MYQRLCRPVVCALTNFLFLVPNTLVTVVDSIQVCCDNCGGQLSSILVGQPQLQEELKPSG